MSAWSTGSDRRTAERHSISITVEYILEDGSVLEGSVENLSRNGVLLITPEKVSNHAILRLRFPSTRGGAPVEIQGKVVRFAPAGAVGVAFVHVEGEALEFVRGLAEA